MICRQCGGEAKEGSIFCPHCGVRLQEAAGAGQETAEVRTEGQAETVREVADVKVAAPEETVGEAVDVKAAAPEEAVREAADVKTAAPEETVKEAADMKTAAQEENVEAALDMPEFEMAEQKRPEEPEQRAEQSRQPEAAPVTAADVSVTGAEASGTVSPVTNTLAAAAVVPPVAVKPEKPGRGKKKAVIVGIAMAAVIVAAVLLAATLFSGGSGKWDVYGKDVIYCIQSGRSGDEIKILNVAGGKVTKGPETSGVTIIEGSLDATTQYVFDIDGPLYLMTGNTWSELTDDVCSAAISVSGDGIVYVTVNDDEYEIYLYDIAKKKSVLVAEELDSFPYVVISADGKSVAYMDTKTSRCHLYINGKEQEDTIKDAYPIALSSGGKYFYYTKNSGLYVMKQGGDAQKLGDMSRKLIFNRDMTQLLYNYNSKTYFCKNGEKADETVAKGTVLPILPDNVQSFQDTIYTENDGCSVTVYGTEELSGFVCEINDGLYYIDKDMSAQRIVSSYTDCEVSADGTALLYLRGDSLYRVKNLKKSLEPEKIEEIPEVSGFAANKALNRIYYLNEDNELMYFSGSGKPVKIYDDDIESVVVIGDKLYFIGDYSRGTGTLYVSDQGSKRKSIAEVTAIENMAGRLYYITEDEELYMLDGDEPVKVLDDIAN